MKLRRLSAAFIITATWLVAASPVAADPVTFENMSGLVGAQDRPGGPPSAQGPSSPRIEIIDDGDVTGTIIRDCGVIDDVPQVFSTGYPKTALYVAMGVAPDICCLLRICCPRRREIPSCTNPPCLSRDVQIIPEPLTVTTLAFGLGALQVTMRRRRGRKRLPNRH
jgi:hypothetical protein